MNLQLWLFESSKNIEIHYGPSLILSPELIYGGLEGDIIGFYDAVDNHFEFDNFWGLSGSTTAPMVENVSSFDSLVIPFSLIGLPSNGTVYKFEATTTKTNDLDKQIEILVYPTITQSIVNMEFNEADVGNLHLWIPI
jgi:hypothetical protein